MTQLTPIPEVPYIPLTRQQGRINHTNPFDPHQGERQSFGRRGLNFGNLLLDQIQPGDRPCVPGISQRR